MDTKQLITGNPKEGFYPIVQDTVTVIELNEAVMTLTSESSSEDIIAAFDSAESFNNLIEQIRNTENIVNGILMNNDGSVGKIICTIAAYKNQYACDIEYFYDGKIIRLDITNTDGTMSCIRKETELGGDSILEIDGDGNKFLSNNGEYKEIPQPNLSNYLAKDNTTEFTPTGDYQPATKKYVDDHNSNYAGGILNIGENNVSYDEDIINYGYLVIFLSGFGNITIPIRVSGGQISEYSTLISISDSVGVGESAYSLARVTMSNLTKNANKYEGTINVAYLHRIIRESDYNDLGTTPETDDVLYFVIPD